MYTCPMYLAVCSSFFQRLYFPNPFISGFRSEDPVKPAWSFDQCLGMIKNIKGGRSLLCRPTRKTNWQVAREKRKRSSHGQSAVDMANGFIDLDRKRVGVETDSSRTESTSPCSTDGDEKKIEDPSVFWSPWPYFGSFASFRVS